MRDAIRWSLYESLVGAIILRYHSVADLPADPADRAVSPVNFAQQMELLRSQYQPIPLRAISRASGVRRLPRRAVVVTFDDGYADNVDMALPVLEKARAGRRPRCVIVTDSGRWAYLANEKSDSISGYRVNSDTGALDSVPGSPFPVEPIQDTT